MNPEFERFRPLIENYNNISLLNTAEGVELKKTCYRHAEANTSGEVGKENIIAVHPYHTELSWLGKNYEESVAEKRRLVEVKKLENLLRTADGSRFKKILFESQLHYAQRSHKLVDEGLIDYVVFTRPNEGVPLDHLPNKGPLLENSSLTPFCGTKTNYVGGTYGYECVRAAIRHIRMFAPYGSIRPITDAIVFNEPTFWQKLDLIMSAGDTIISGMNSAPSFFLNEKIYSLIKGVESKEILG